jgi:hypothetical protein
LTELIEKWLEENEETSSSKASENRVTSQRAITKTAMSSDQSGVF